MKVSIFILIFLFGAILIFFILRGIRHRFGRVTQTSEISRRLDTTKAILKGWLRRFFIFLGHIKALSHALTVSGAIKTGTRQHTARNHAVSNDYFLIGNMVTILAGIFISWYGTNGRIPSGNTCLLFKFRFG